MILICTRCGCELALQTSGRKRKYCVACAKMVKAETVKLNSQIRSMHRQKERDKIVYCKLCGSALHYLKQAGRRRLYCSACKKKNDYVRQKRKAKAEQAGRPLVACPHCHQPVMQFKGRIFCSRKCLYRYHQEKNKNKQISAVYCRICMKEFIPKCRSTRHCSRQCLGIAFRILQPWKIHGQGVDVDNIKPINCSYCNDGFKPVGLRTKFCSFSCKRKYFRDKRAVIRILIGDSALTREDIPDGIFEAAKALHILNQQLWRRKNHVRI